MLFASFYALANWNAWGHLILIGSFSDVFTYALDHIFYFLPDLIGQQSRMLIYPMKCIALFMMIYKESLKYYIILLLMAAIFAFSTVDRRGRKECLVEENGVNLEWVSGVTLLYYAF